ncbi:AAA family ATPase [Methylorubrum suomiense]|uniref:AAA family ATPase n=1 Tax=Methylorubrum suomiense TaxID=144191 RepID=A0ABQ4UYL4_9HYPH|nr:AAA family ATPase [Methylorubrum suomiense]GJE77238.1 hypothetical protein BGCPKDLD_3841 [Methylorubrum suomiense]
MKGAPLDPWPPLEEEVPAAPARPSQTKPAGIQARRFEWIDPAEIPRREWLLGRHLIRKFISATISPGGVGKSSLAIAEALSLATGRNLIGQQPFGRRRVWYVNLEDPYDELQRRVIATALHYGIDPADLDGFLYVNSGRDGGIVVARQERSGIVLAEPVLENLRTDILGKMIDCMMVDPFVSCHEVDENSNGAINAVATAWADLADRTEIAIDLIHHSKKTGGNEVQVEDARGASALLSKARAGRVLNVMSKEEAERAGIENRRSHFRVDSGKANLAPASSDAATWFKLESVMLPNGGKVKGIPLDGDSVGVVTAWQWPDAMEAVTVSHLREVQRRMAQSGPWRESVQSPDWIGNLIGEVMGLDPTAPKDRNTIKTALKAWLASGMVKVKTIQDESRKARKCVVVGELATD